MGRYVTTRLVVDLCHNGHASVNRLADLVGDDYFSKRSHLIALKIGEDV